MNGIQPGTVPGWFSLGLGVEERAASGRMARGLGSPAPPAAVGLLGMRDAGCGRPAPGWWC